MGERVPKRPSSAHVVVVVCTVKHKHISQQQTEQHGETMKTIQSRLNPYIAKWLAAAESGKVSWQIAWDAIQNIELAVAETCEHLKTKNQSLDIIAAGANDALNAAKLIINSKTNGNLKLTYVGALTTELEKEHSDALKRIA